MHASISSVDPSPLNGDIHTVNESIVRTVHGNYVPDESLITLQAHSQSALTISERAILPVFLKQWKRPKAFSE